MGDAAARSGRASLVAQRCKRRDYLPANSCRAILEINHCFCPSEIQLRLTSNDFGGSRRDSLVNERNIVVAKNKSKKTQTLAELEEAYRVSSINLQGTLSDPDFLAGDEMPDPDNLPTSADDIEFAAGIIIQASLNLQYDALDWHKASKALAAARTKVKRTA